MKVKEFIVYQNMPLEEHINNFIALNKGKIDIVDIKFCTRGESTRAFILYNHKPMTLTEQLKHSIGYEEWCEKHKDEETTTPA